MVRIGFLFALCSLALPVQAADLTCPRGAITVSGDDRTLIEQTCEIAESAADRLAACNAPITRPVRIEIVGELLTGCVGLYHCGEDWIEILPPATAIGLRSVDSPFQNLSSDDYFASIVTHEMAHAAYDEATCPFADCPATAEYVAYAMQVGALTADQIVDFEAAADIDRRVGHDELNRALLMMNPNGFAARTWTHFSQREDGCAYIGLVMSGNILFDTERP
ncbi:hypothetical protein [Pseudoruegeria sp. HB172150]|uniref:hypothetical protein n=1 Tax=Pseudoruegeria sp. HB172150 TaxID=2721164 RepID=UPI001556DC54|nr:hypothetical protein [Pseudoruegeria sp. HB172150]